MQFSNYVKVRKAKGKGSSGWIREDGRKNYSRSKTVVQATNCFRNVRGESALQQYYFT